MKLVISGLISWSRDLTWKSNNFKGLIFYWLCFLSLGIWTKLFSDLVVHAIQSLYNRGFVSVKMPSTPLSKQNSEEMKCEVIRYFVKDTKSSFLMWTLAGNLELKARLDQKVALSSFATVEGSLDICNIAQHSKKGRGPLVSQTSLGTINMTFGVTALL